jgi:hypothetical protein
MSYDTRRIGRAQADLGKENSRMTMPPEISLFLVLRSIAMRPVVLIFRVIRLPRVDGTRSIR